MFAIRTNQSIWNENWEIFFFFCRVCSCDNNNDACVHWMSVTSWKSLSHSPVMTNQLFNTGSSVHFFSSLQYVIRTIMPRDYSGFQFCFILFLLCFVFALPAVVRCRLSASEMWYLETHRQFYKLLCWKQNDRGKKKKNGAKYRIHRNSCDFCWQ